MKAGSGLLASPKWQRETGDMYQGFLTQFTVLEHHLFLPSILSFCLSFRFHMCFLLAVFFQISPLPFCKIFPHVASLKLLVVGKRRGSARGQGGTGPRSLSWQ